MATPPKLLLSLDSLGPVPARGRVSFYRNADGSVDMRDAAGNVRRFAEAGGGVQSVQAGDNVSVDNSDPQNPVVSALGGGGAPAGSSAALQAAIMAATPHAYYPLTGSYLLDTMALDASGNGYDCPLAAPVTLLKPLIPADDALFPYWESPGAYIMYRSAGIGLPSPLSHSLSICMLVQRFDTAYGWTDIQWMGTFNASSGESPSSNFQFSAPRHLSGSQAGLAFWEYSSGADQSVGTSPGLLGVSVTEPCMLHLVKDSATKTVVMYKNGLIIAAPAHYAHEPSGSTPQNAGFGIGRMAMGHVAVFAHALTAADVMAHAKAAGFA